MGADHELRRAIHHRRLCGALGGRLELAGQPGDAHAQRGEPLLDLAEVLLGQDLGGRHQRGLLAGFNGTRRRQRGDHGLAAAHVALHQPVRGPVLRQVGLDLAPHPLLRRSQRERQRGQQACHQIARGRQRGGAAAGALASRQAQAQLLRQQLVELHALPQRVAVFRQRRLVGVRGRVMQAAQAGRQLRQAPARAQRRRQGVGDVHVEERLRNALAQQRLRHAGAGRVHRGQPLRQCHARPGRMHARVDHFGTQQADPHAAVDTHPAAGRHLLLGRRVEVQEAQQQAVAGVVAQRGEQLTPAPVGHLAALDHALGLGLCAGRQPGHRRDARLVLVAQRQVQNEVPFAGQAQARQLGRERRGGCGHRRLRPGRLACRAHAPAAGQPPAACLAPALSRAGRGSPRPRTARPWAGWPRRWSSAPETAAAPPRP